MVVEKCTENEPHREGFCANHSRQDGASGYLTGSVSYPAGSTTYPIGSTHYPGAGNFNPAW